MSLTDPRQADALRRGFNDFLRRHFVSAVVAVVCLVLFVGINLEPSRSSLDAYVSRINPERSRELLSAMFRWGAPSTADIRNGHLWGLVTCNFLEPEFLWLFFAMAWLLTLGRFIEQRVGALFYLWLIVSTCVLASVTQIAIFDETHYGFGPITYSMFGFVWVNSMLNVHGWRSRPDIGILFLGWAVICFAVNYTQIHRFAYSALFFGFVWGALLAYLRLLRAKSSYVKWVTQAALPLLLLGLCSVSLFWAPWSVDWLGYEASKYYARKDYDRAESLYQRILKKDSTNEFARQGLRSIGAARIEQLSGEAESYRNGGDYEREKGVYTRILALDAENEFAKENLKRMRIGELAGEFERLYSAGKFPEARRICSDILDIDPKNEGAKGCVESLPGEHKAVAALRRR